MAASVAAESLTFLNCRFLWLSSLSPELSSYVIFCGRQKVWSGCLWCGTKHVLIWTRHPASSSSITVTRKITCKKKRANSVAISPTQLVCLCFPRFLAIFTAREGQKLCHSETSKASVVQTAPTTQQWPATQCPRRCPCCLPCSTTSITSGDRGGSDQEEAK